MSSMPGFNCLGNISYTCLFVFSPSTQKFITWQPQPKNNNIHVKDKTVFYWTYTIMSCIWLPWKKIVLDWCGGSQPIIIFCFLNFAPYEKCIWKQIFKNLWIRIYEKSEIIEKSQIIEKSKKNRIKIKKLKKKRKNEGRFLKWITPRYFKNILWNFLIFLFD